MSPWLIVQGNLASESHVISMKTSSRCLSVQSCWSKAIVFKCRMQRHWKMEVRGCDSRRDYLVQWADECDIFSGMDTILVGVCESLQQ